MDLYLLGAGFSSDAGLPTMKNFIKNVPSVQSAYHRNPVNSVLTRALKYALAHREENIETLLEKAVNSPVFFDLIWTFGITVNYYSRQFLDRCKTDGEIGWYEDFTRRIATTGARVITLNYDLVLEEVLWREGYREDYRLTFHEVHPAPELTPAGPAVQVLKLHGSISWLWCIKCGYTVNRCRHILTAVYTETPCPRCSCRLVPLLIPPTFRKALSFGPILHRLWEQADILINRAERIVVGGLSLAERDADFRERFLEKVYENKRLKELVLINRDPATCQEICRVLPALIPCKIYRGFAQFCLENNPE